MNDLQQIFGQLRVASTAFDRKMLLLRWAVLKRRSKKKYPGFSWEYSVKEY